MNHLVPADVPFDVRSTYISNLETITHGTGRLFLFAGDQKVEHLNADFVGEGIAIEDATPEHLFNIASKAKIGAFATQLGLISKYGSDFTSVPYIVKLNAKTDLVKISQKDPLSASWTSIDALMRFKKSSGLNIVGIGYTIYPGSENEAQMFAEAAKYVFEAHQHGLISIIWSYARGKAVQNEKDPHIVAGCAGVVACMGADFVKINAPVSDTVSSSEALKEAVSAAGRTKVICAGGGNMGAGEFLQSLHDQIHIAGCAGNATGRNIHQRPLVEAIRFCNAIYGMTVDNLSVDEAMRIYEQI